MKTGTKIFSILSLTSLPIASAHASSTQHTWEFTNKMSVPLRVQFTSKICFEWAISNEFEADTSALTVLPGETKSVSAKDNDSRSCQGVRKYYNYSTQFINSTGNSEIIHWGKSFEPGSVYSMRPDVWVPRIHPYTFDRANKNITITCNLNRFPADCSDSSIWGWADSSGQSWVKTTFEKID